MNTGEHIYQEIRGSYEQSPVESIQLGREMWSKMVIPSDTLTAAVLNVEVNGYQSWSVSTVYHRGQRDAVLTSWTRPIWSYCHMQYYGDYLIRPHREDVVSHGYILLELGSTYLLIGQSNPSEVMCQFGWHWEKGLSIYFECNQQDSKPGLVFYQGKKEEIFDRFAAQFKVELVNEKIRGWTSWYQYYQDINQEIIRSQMAAMSQSSIPINLVQIDDGWQRETGDWRPNSAFPDFDNLITEIRDQVEYAGIWLAPFICSKKSRIYKHHRHWIMKNASGALLRCARQPGWGGVAYVLNLDLPEVRAFVFGMIRNLVYRGVNFFKMDFLYAAAYGGNGKTRAQRMTMAMKLLRSAIGDSKLLACGVPLFQVLGYADYVRIGPDIGNNWENWLQAKLLKYPERVSTKMAITTCQTRAWMDGRVLNADPDVFVLRQQHTKLSRIQKESLLKSVQQFDSIRLTSDDPRQWSNTDQAHITGLFNRPDAMINIIEPTDERR